MLAEDESEIAGVELGRAEDLSTWMKASVYAMWFRQVPPRKAEEMSNTFVALMPDEPDDPEHDEGGQARVGGPGSIAKR